jgi:hypothetical protein
LDTGTASSGTAHVGSSQPSRSGSGTSTGHSSGSPPGQSSGKSATQSAVVGKNDKGALEAAVNVRIDLSAVPFESAEDRRTGFLDLGVFCGDSKDRLVGQAWQKADLALKPENFQRLLSDGLRLTLRVPLSSPADTVKVVVYSYAADRIGSATAKTKALK